MAPDHYLCPTCGQNVVVGKNCRCTKPRQKKKRQNVPDPKPWEKEYDYDGGVPEDNFDYDEFIAQEFGDGPPHKGVGIALHWWITAVILAIACFFFFVL
jgi:hypothetical protein